ncbi:unnamed protein product [Closterium sp. NIES-65]|nr:unnamed protein product [Closterium sp. NIES-65]
MPIPRHRFHSPLFPTFPPISPETPSTTTPPGQPPIPLRPTFPSAARTPRLLLEGLDVAALVLHQFDYYRYEGAQVMTINGAPAMEYLLEWAARYVGQYRDSGVRFNLLFARRVVSKATGAVIATQGAFAQRSIAPTNDSVVVELILATSATPVQVTVPWVAVLPTNFDSATSYWAANCATPRQPTASAAAASAPAAASAAAAAAAAEGSRGIGAAGVDLGARSRARGTDWALDADGGRGEGAGDAAKEWERERWGERERGDGRGEERGEGRVRRPGPLLSERLKKRACGVGAWVAEAAAESTEGAESTLTGNGAESVGSADNAESTGGTEGTEKGAERTVGAGVWGSSRAGMGDSSAERASGWPTLAVEFPRPDLDARPSLLRPPPPSPAAPLLFRSQYQAAAAAAESAESAAPADAASSAAAGSNGRASSAPAPNDLAGAQKMSTATALIPVGAVYLRAENATAVYLLADNATAVIWLHTFLPAMDGSDEALIAFLLTEISTAVDLANQHGKRIIMDVSGNGGGYADIAYLLLRLVAGKQKAPEGRVQMPQQLLISNAFMLSLLDKQLTSFYQWDKYVKVDEATPVKSVRDFKPFLEETFSPDGETGVYSGLFKLAAFPGLEKVPFRGPVFGARPLVIVTNGNCFSACAIFTHNLRKRFNVKHVTVGGVLGQPLGISASCMGATMPSLETGVTNFLTGTKLANHPRAPKPFPYNVVQGVAVVQGYVEDKVPCEYVFLPGDQHVDLTMDKVANPALVWTEASQYY